MVELAHDITPGLHCDTIVTHNKCDKSANKYLSQELHIVHHYSHEYMNHRLQVIALVVNVIVVAFPAMIIF